MALIVFCVDSDCFYTCPIGAPGQVLNQLPAEVDDYSSILVWALAIAPSRVNVGSIVGLKFDPSFIVSYIDYSRKECFDGSAPGSARSSSTRRRSRWTRGATATT